MATTNDLKHSLEHNLNHNHDQRPHEVHRQCGQMALFWFHKCAIGLHPLEHLEMASLSCVDAGRLSLWSSVGLCPVEHVEMTALGCPCTRPRVPRIVEGEEMCERKRLYL
jgi:hypothetical protein